MTDPAPTPPRTSRIAQLAAALAAASLTCVLVSIVGVQWDFLTPLTSFGLFSVGALLGGALTLVLAIIAVVFCILLRKQRNKNQVITSAIAF